MATRIKSEAFIRKENPKGQPLTLDVYFSIVPLPSEVHLNRVLSTSIKLIWGKLCRDNNRCKSVRLDFASESPYCIPIHFRPSKKK